jgi:hypothetical protein
MNETFYLEMWQIEVGGQIYETSFDELPQWVFEGSLLPQDKVRRGNLRWIEANKVPVLLQYFNAKERGEPPPNIVNLQKANLAKNPQFSEKRKCAIHSDVNSTFDCEVCASSYCQNCLETAYSAGKTCPMCGAELPAQTVTASVVSFAPSDNFAQNRIHDFSDTSMNLPSLPQTTSKVSFPSDVVNSKSKKSIGVFSIILISLLTAGLISYLWAYQFNIPNKNLEDALPEIVALDSQHKTELEKENRLIEEIEEKRRKEQLMTEIKQPPMPSMGCTDGMGKTIECDERLLKITEKMSKRQNNTVNTINEINKPAIDSSYFPNALPIIEKKYHTDRSQIIEKYRQSKSSRSFIIAFIFSFAGLFAGLFIVRNLIKR